MTIQRILNPGNFLKVLDQNKILIGYYGVYKPFNPGQVFDVFKAGCPDTKNFYCNNEAFLKWLMNYGFIYDMFDKDPVILTLDISPSVSSLIVEESR